MFLLSCSSFFLLQNKITSHLINSYTQFLTVHYPYTPHFILFNCALYHILDWTFLLVSISSLTVIVQSWMICCVSLSFMVIFLYHCLFSYCTLALTINYICYVYLLIILYMLVHVLCTFIYRTLNEYSSKASDLLHIFLS